MLNSKFRKYNYIPKCTNSNLLCTVSTLYFFQNRNLMQGSFILKCVMVVLMGKKHILPLSATSATMLRTTLIVPGFGRKVVNLRR